MIYDLLSYLLPIDFDSSLLDLSFLNDFFYDDKGKQEMEDSYNDLTFSQVFNKDEFEKEETKGAWWWENSFGDDKYSNDYSDCSFTTIFIAFELELPYPFTVGGISVYIDFYFRIKYWPLNQEGSVTKHCEDYDEIWDLSADNLPEAINLEPIFMHSPVTVHLSIGIDATFGVPFFNAGMTWGSETGIDMTGWGQKISVFDLSWWEPQFNLKFWEGFNIHLTDGVWETFQGKYVIMRLSFLEIGIGMDYTFLLYSDVHKLEPVYFNYWAPLPEFN